MLVLPGFLLYAAVIYRLFHLYHSKWRFASLPETANILGASTVLALTLVVIDYILVAPNVLGAFFFGKLTIILYWLIQIFLLGGPRIAYRYFRYTRTRRAAKVADASPILVLGRAADAEVLMRAIESGAVKKIWPVGILSPSPADQNQSIRGIAVLGGFDDLEEVIAQTDGARAAGIPDHPHAGGAGAAGASGEDPDQGAAARSRDAAAAVAGGGQRGAAAGGGARRGPAAAAEREDRLSAGWNSRWRENRLSSPAVAARSAPKSATGS